MFIENTIKDILKDKNQDDLILTLTYQPSGLDTNTPEYSWEWVDQAELTVKSQTNRFPTFGICFHTIEAASIIRVFLMKQGFAPFAYSDAHLPEYRLLHFEAFQLRQAMKLVLLHDNPEVSEWLLRYSSKDYPLLYDERGEIVYYLDSSSYYTATLCVCPVTVGRKRANDFPVQFTLKWEEILGIKEAKL